nr:hypothetical protein Iba_chr01bCG2680 [Ipomoea batatas]
MVMKAAIGTRHRRPLLMPDGKGEVRLCRPFLCTAEPTLIPLIRLFLSDEEGQGKELADHHPAAAVDTCSLPGARRSLLRAPRWRELGSSLVQVRCASSTPSSLTPAAASLSSFLRRLPTRLKIEMKAKKMVKISTSAVIKPFDFNSVVTPWNNEITDANVSNAFVPKNQVTPPLEIGAKRSCGNLSDKLGLEVTGDGYRGGDEDGDSVEEFKQEQDETFRKQDSVEEFKQEQEETFRKLSSANSLPVLNDINAMESPDIVAKAAKEIKFQPPQVPEMVMM